MLDVEPSMVTFSPDDAAMKDIRLLAARWNTSPAGVVRRAVAEAVHELQAFPTVQQALQQYRAMLRRQRGQAAAERDQRLPTAK